MDIAGFEREFSGDDGFDAEELGAVNDLLARMGLRRQAQGRPQPKRIAAQSLPVLSPPAVPYAGASPVLAMKKIPLGINSVLFNATSGTTLTAEVEPQCGYTPKRLIVIVTRTGTTAVGSVRITSLKHGNVEQLPASNGCPAGMFDPQATDAELDLTGLTPGMKVLATVTITAAPTGTDTVLAELAYYGKAVGQ